MNLEDSREEEKHFEDHLNNLSNHIGNFEGGLADSNFQVTPLDSNLNSNNASPETKKERVEL